MRGRVATSNTTQRRRRPCRVSLDFVVINCSTDGAKSEDNVVAQQVLPHLSLSRCIIVAKNGVCEIRVRVFRAGKGIDRTKRKTPTPPFTAIVISDVRGSRRRRNLLARSLAFALAVSTPNHLTHRKKLETIIVRMKGDAIESKVSF